MGAKKKKLLGAGKGQSGLEVSISCTDSSITNVLWRFCGMDVTAWISRTVNKNCWWLRDIWTACVNWEKHEKLNFLECIHYLRLYPDYQCQQRHRTSWSRTMWGPTCQPWDSPQLCIQAHGPLQPAQAYARLRLLPFQHSSCWLTGCFPIGNSGFSFGVISHCWLLVLEPPLWLVSLLPLPLLSSHLCWFSFLALAFFCSVFLFFVLVFRSRWSPYH